MRALSCAREMENLDRPREPTILFVKTAGRPALPWPTIHDKFCQEEKDSPSALGGARRTKDSTVSQCAVCLSARFLRYAEPSIHLLPRATAGPQLSQKIEFVFSASPETSGREPRELALRRPAVKVRDLADCAPSDVFFSGSSGFMPRRCCDPDSSQMSVRRDRLLVSKPLACGPPRA